MTLTEIIVVLGGLAIGYWVVSAFLTRDADSTPKQNSDPYFQEEDSKRGREGGFNASGVEELSSSWHIILGVSETASSDEIILAYKRQMREYHPDKVAHMGAEIRELAEAKSKQINAAYDYAMTRRRPT